MKFRHTIHGLYEVSFTSVEQINPSTNEPTGVVLDQWREIQAASAIGLEELLERIDTLEARIEMLFSEKGIIQIMQRAKAQAEQPEPQKKELPRGESLNSVLAKSKGGRPKKAEAKP